MWSCDLELSGGGAALRVRIANKNVHVCVLEMVIMEWYLIMAESSSGPNVKPMAMASTQFLVINDQTSLGISVSLSLPCLVAEWLEHRAE